MSASEPKEIPPPGFVADNKVMEDAWDKERKKLLRELESQKQAMQKVREVLHSAASNRRFMQIAGPARQCLNILNPFFPS